MDIKALENKIQEIEKQIDIDKNELRIIYISKIFSKKPDDSFISLNADDFTSDEEFDKIKKNSSLECLQYTQRNGYYGSWGYEKGLFSYNFSNIEKEVDSKYSYDKREEMIKSKVDGKLNLLRNKLKEKNFDLSECSKKNIKKLLETVSPEKFTCHLEKQDEKFNNFIIYLLRRGYIDENYFEYISNFYANSLSVHETQYLLLIKNQQSPNFELILSSVDKVIKRIKDIEWRLSAILNNSMLSYILITDDYHLKDFLETLRNYKLLSHDDFFLSKFSAGSNCLSRLYQGLYKFLGHENNWINVIFDNEEISILYYFFIYVDFEKTEENILSYLKRDVSFLHLDNIEKENVSSKINYYGLKFNLLEDTIKYPIYNIILDNNAYIISKQNFDIIIKNAFADTVEMPIKDYFTQISKLQNQNVKTYVIQNIETFVKEVVLSIDGSIAESEDAFVELLNNSTLLTETKIELIEKNDCVISDITKIQSTEIKLADGDEKSVDIRNLLYKHKKVYPAWSNVFEIFKIDEKKTDDSLIDYLNDEKIVAKLVKEKPLTNEEIKFENGNYDIASKFYRTILNLKILTLDSFSELMDVCPWIYKKINYGIDQEKLNVLIEQEKLVLTQENYTGIKQNHVNILPKFIATYFDDFAEKWSELKIEITFDDMKMFLDSKELSKEQKNKLLSSDFDIWYAVSQQDDALTWLGRKIIELNLEGKVQVPIASVVANMDDADNVLKLLCLQGRNLKENEIIDVINSKMDESYRLCIKREGKREKLPNTGLNKELCAILSEKGIISSYQEDGKKIRVIQKRM